VKALEEKIIAEGKICPGHILKVGNFLNQRLDTDFLFEMGREIHRLFESDNVTKIVTVEASGIAIAMAAAFYFHVPAVFAKKGKCANVTGEVYSSTVHSYTYDRDFDVMIAKEYVSAEDRVLIVDDFLATGEAVAGLADIVDQAGATLVGVCAAIEKGFQKGGDNLRAKGIRVESLAIIDDMDGEGIKFRP
jgi:xanthine phosphoribosyltransferase